MSEGTSGLQGTRALVTGASSGVGLAVVRLFLRAGATVHGVARRLDAMQACDPSALADGVRVNATADARPASTSSLGAER